MEHDDELKNKFGAGFTPADDNGMTNAVTINAIRFTGKDPDTIQYLLLLYVYDENDTDVDREGQQFWSIKTGRQNVYDYLMNVIESEAIDVDLSFILAEGSKVSDAMTVYDFMATMKKENMIIDNTDFNVHDYHCTEEPYPYGNLLNMDPEILNM